MMDSESIVRQIEYWKELGRKYMYVAIEATEDDDMMATHAMQYTQTRVSELEKILHEQQWKNMLSE